MSLAVPNQLNYREGILPVAIESRSNKRVFEPVNGTEFTPGGNFVIRFNINSDNLWDISHSYLQVKLTNMAKDASTEANNRLTLDDGVPWLNRVQIMSGGAELENIDEYLRLHCLMQQIQGNPSQAGECALTNNQNFPLTSAPGTVATLTDPAAHKDATGAPDPSSAAELQEFIKNACNDVVTGFNDVLANLGSDSVYKHSPVTDKNRTLSGGGKDAKVDASYSSSFTYNINLISAILNTPKYFPLIFTNLGLDVLLYLESSANIGVWGTDSGGGSDAASTEGYKISDCKWHCHMVDVDRTFYDRLRQSMMSTGGMLQFSGTTYRHYLESHDQNSTTHNLTIPTRVKSLNALYIRPQRQELNNNNRVFSLSVTLVKDVK
jgi:hypothetical protein